MLMMLRLMVAAAMMLSMADATAASPKVLGLDFKKEIRRDSSNFDGLRRRQDWVETDITNANIYYQINVTIGTPPQVFGLQLDTGSSDIWVPAVDSDVCLADRRLCALGEYNYLESNTFATVDAPPFEIAYVDNSQIYGIYFTDTLVMGTTRIRKMQMGLASSSPSRDFGIMGIGFQSGESIAEYYPSEIYPNVINQLKNQGYIKTLAYSLWLNDLESSTGSILFGGVDTEKYQGNLTVLPIQPDSRTGNITSMTVVLASVDVTNAVGENIHAQAGINIPVIFDCGATDTYMPDSIVQPILNGVGAKPHDALEYVVPCSLAQSKATLSFKFGGPDGPTIVVDLSEFVRRIPIPSYRPTFDDGSPVCIWGLKAAGVRPSLFGDTFLRSAYVVYDLETAEIAVAQTIFNTTESNIVEFSDEQIPNASATVSGVAARQTFSGVPGPQGVTPNLGETRGFGAPAKPTFSLDGAGTAIPIRALETVTIATGVVFLVSLVFGGSLVWSV